MKTATDRTGDAALPLRLIASWPATVFLRCVTRADSILKWLAWLHKFDLRHNRDIDQPVALCGTVSCPTRISPRWQNTSNTGERNTLILSPHTHTLLCKGQNNAVGGTVWFAIVFCFHKKFSGSTLDTWGVTADDKKIWLLRACALDHLHSFQKKSNANEFLNATCNSRGL